MTAPDTAIRFGAGESKRNAIPPLPNLTRS